MGAGQAAYTASTAAVGNPALILASLITSEIFGWQRDATGGVLAPAVTRVTWSVLMLRFISVRDTATPISLFCTGQTIFRAA